MRRGATRHLSGMINRLHPADMGRVLDGLPEDLDKKDLFALVWDVRAKARILKETSAATRDEVLNGLSEQEVASMMQELSSDDVVTIAKGLSPEKYENVLGQMGREDSQRVRGSLSYPEKTAGRLMNTDYFSMQQELTVEAAVEEVRKARERQIVVYVYVTDATHRLVGVLSLRELLVAPPDQLLKEVMNPEVIFVMTDTDQEEVAQQVTRYDLLGIPVVNQENGLTGIITFDDVIDVVREEATEDILKLAGTGVPEDESELYGSSLKSVRFRLPWLMTTLFGMTLCSWIIWTFRFTLQEVVALITFIPVIAAMGGTVGVQSSTIMVRGLATGKVEMSSLWKIFIKEVKIGLMMALVCGLFLGVLSYIWYGHGILGIVLGTAMFMAISFAAAMGTLVPVAFKKIDIDPAVSSGPLVTTFNDITSLSIYLGLATLLLQYLK